MAEIPFAALPSGGGVKCGVFTGDGKDGHKISLGATPEWVAVWSQNGLQGLQDYTTLETAGGLAIKGHPCYAGETTEASVEIVDGGFIVNFDSFGRGNADGKTYYYLYGI